MVRNHILGWIRRGEDDVDCDDIFGCYMVEKLVGFTRSVVQAAVQVI